MIQQGEEGRSKHCSGNSAPTGQEGWRVWGLNVSLPHPGPLGVILRAAGRGEGRGFGIPKEQPSCWVQVQKAAGSPPQGTPSTH